MVVVPCPVSGCVFETSDQEPSVVAALLQLHAADHAATSAGRTGPKLQRPRIDAGVDEEIWNSFVRRWEAYRAGSQISDSAAAVQLLQCASEGLADLALRSNLDVLSTSVEQLLAALRELAVVPVARGVKRAELLRMNQCNDEAFRTFTARVRGKAEVCGFRTDVKCSCDQLVIADYTEEVIRDVILAGVRDTDIRREALSANGLQEGSVNDIIAFVENREMASKAVSTRNSDASSLAATSTFKQQRAVPGKPMGKEKPESAVCPDCGNRYSLFKRNKRGIMNRMAFKICFDCWQSRREIEKKSSSVTILAASQISALRPTPKGKLGHCIFRDGKWKAAKFREHPKLKISLRSENRHDSVVINCIADTGAQSNMWGYRNYIEAGFLVSDLQHTSSGFCVADLSPLDVVGVFKGVFQGEATDGQVVSCRSLVYISKSVNAFFLSRDTMEDLHVINSSFPEIGQFFPAMTAVSENQHAEAKGDPPCDETCKCPERSAVPNLPSQLPFAAIPENIPKMRAWLLHRFAASTFNVCPHRPLHQMSGPPIQIHLDENAKPHKPCDKAATIPLHWQKQVHDDIVRDEALGVIERVPYGVPSTWCHRMVVTRKHDGTPRRTVDLSPLNRFCKRESHSGESPFLLARRVPGGTWKTVSDAWNGYHSVPLRESDRHLTTFITPFGRYRYRRAPQGFLSSGDGYNRRFGEILRDFERKERCVDDTIFYDTTLESHWWRALEFLSTVGSAGIVLHPDKFQFCERTVNFAGFRISENSIEPLPKYLDAIKSFPTPKGITDVRSWFGLLNQVSNYGQLRDAIAPFRKFLSPKNKFYWDEELDDAFNKSKAVIVDAIREGVRIFDITKLTCLRTDWSKRGLGYFLLQKHCSCESNLPNCCQDGWVVTLAGSRFLSSAEGRYAAIEGEALAVAWALEQTRYFTQICDNLLIVTDHKPLVKIFGDRTLDEIDNTRLFRFKQRTLPWYFKIFYLPGKTNCAADTVSRYPHSRGEMNTVHPDEFEDTLIMAALGTEVRDRFAISWTNLVEETNKDPVLCNLKRAIREGFAEIYPDISPFIRFKSSLFLDGDVIIYKDRAVIPTSLRARVLRILHSAHQGVSSMERRSQATVLWPGFYIRHPTGKRPVCGMQH